MTCADIIAMGSQATALTATDINGLGDQDFSDCMETLGAIDGWTSTQLAALAARAKQV